MMMIIKNDEKDILKIKETQDGGIYLLVENSSIYPDRIHISSIKLDKELAESMALGIIHHLEGEDDEKSDRN
jgi:hypothetical protein